MGDRNTTYFQKHAEARKQFKVVQEIQDQGHVITRFDKIKEEATKHFSSIYIEDCTTHPREISDSMDLVPTLLQRTDNINLCKPIMLEELKAVVEDMEEDKALGLDGFSARFITSCWDIIHKDLFKMVLKSQNCNKIRGSTNSAFVALNPKEKDATTFDRFRPISLCNIGYKIITKIMAIRIKGILHKIIPVNQGAFIEGRKIWDNIILVQEAIHSCL